MIDSFLVADPPLKLGWLRIPSKRAVRGSYGTDARTLDGWRGAWGLFHTLADDDIIEVASPLGVNNFGFFQNAGSTLRQGIEAKIDYRYDRWNAYANFTYVDATYQSAITLFSPNNPNALTDPNNDDVQFVNVKPGDHIPGIPASRFKAGSRARAVTDAWKVGGDLNFTGSQYLVHDDTNQSPKVPAYTVLNSGAHLLSRLTPNIELPRPR